MLKSLIYRTAKTPRAPRIRRVCVSPKDIREIIFGSYRIVYLVSNEQVNILTVFHSSRQLKL
ncbi:type II toxin-antitoxin system RelE/ParE family toxin [Nostoc sp. CHAB 5715]|uniref:type II toxin-antitoxin system RelE/ParE family toxin n=1 Tax=Nostoc sp. CHAB 5715 TaxID=2780400 RepID=UPI0034D2A04D